MMNFLKQSFFLFFVFCQLGLFGILEDNIENKKLQSVSSIINKHIKTIGGIKKINKIKSLIVKGRFVHDLNWKNPKVQTESFKMISEAPNKLFIIIKTKNGISEKRFNGSFVWEKKTDGIENSYTSNYPRLPWILNPNNLISLKKLSEKMIFKSIIKIDNRKNYMIEIPDRKKSKWTLYFDVETGLLNRIGYHLYLKDYRSIDGIKFPHQIIRGRKGGSSTYYLDYINIKKKK